MDKIVFVNVGRALRAQRVLVGRTQADLGRALGVKPQHVANFEGGVCLPPIKYWRQISQALSLKRKGFKSIMAKEFEAYLDRVLE
jgi:DNA-binding XRE family transcriptional regulator